MYIKLNYVVISFLIQKLTRTSNAALFTLRMTIIISLKHEAETPPRIYPTEILANIRVSLPPAL